jgi:hypothetical protein
VPYHSAVQLPPQPPQFEPVLFEVGERVAVRDTFAVDSVARPFHWEAVVTARTVEEDYLGRPVHEVLFGDLELRFADAEGEVIHVESGGSRRVVFLNDCVLQDCDSKEETLYRAVREKSRRHTAWTEVQVVRLENLAPRRRSSANTVA